MSLFSSNKQQTNYTDNSANAGDGSVAIGSGASVAISTSDPATISAALTPTVAAIGRSLASVDYAEAQGTTRYLASLEAIRSDADASRRSEESVLNAAQNSIDSNNALAAQLAAQVADSKKDPNNQTVETVAKYAAVAAVVGGLLLFFLSRKR